MLKLILYQQKKREAQKYLNTSHVKVNHTAKDIKELQKANLNTSHVKVNHFNCSIFF